MKVRANILVVTGLVLGGCAYPRGGLVHIDTDQILTVAKREIEAKCHEFRMEDYEPVWVCYRTDVNSGAEGTISITYLSRAPSDVTDAHSLTNGPPRSTSTYQAADFLLSRQGILQRQNIGEWSDVPEWRFVRFSEVTRVNPKTKELSNEASQAIGASAPQPER